MRKGQRVAESSTGIQSTGCSDDRLGLTTSAYDLGFALESKSFLKVLGTKMGALGLRKFVVEDEADGASLMNALGLTGMKRNGFEVSAGHEVGHNIEHTFRM